MIEWIVTSSILIAVIVVLRFIMKGKISLCLQYALWALVLVRLLVPVNFGSSELSAENLIAAAEKYPAVQMVYELGQKNMSAQDFGSVGDQMTGEHKTNDVAVSMPEGEEPENFNDETYNMISETGIVEIVKRMALYVWIAGIFAVGLIFFISNLHFWRRIKKSRRLLENSGQLPVYLTETVDTPCLFGFFRPAIYVTPEAAEDETVLKHATAHEMTHYRHGDHIWSILRGVCVALHWYNPMVWCAAFLSQRDGELACDEATIRHLGEKERAEYGRTLILMTCQKRTSLFMAATTMTGNKSNIKERIVLIANRPKMAIYTLIAVVLIAAAAVGCTFTGGKDTPWSWAQELRQDSIVSAVSWSGNDNIEALDVDEINELISLMNRLKKSDFTENKRSAGGTPEYGLRVETADGIYYLNQTNSIEMGYADRLWWIDNDDLTDFIKNTAAQNNIGFAISDDVGKEIPDAVKEYAKAYVRKKIADFDELGANVSDESRKYKIADARITGIENTGAGTAALNEGVAMYRLEYRLLPDRPENVMLLSSIRTDNEWITEDNGAGQPYLLLYYREIGGETVWRGIGVIYGETVEKEYGTPEMLERYGNAYTAAAAEAGIQYLYSHTGEGISNLFGGENSMSAAVYSADKACDLTDVLSAA